MDRPTQYDPEEEKTPPAVAEVEPRMPRTIPWWVGFAALGWASLATFLAVGLIFEANAARDAEAAYRAIDVAWAQAQRECEGRSLDFQWRANRCEALERASQPASPRGLVVPAPKSGCADWKPNPRDPHSLGECYDTRTGEFYLRGKPVTPQPAPPVKEYIITAESKGAFVVSIDMDGNVELGPNAKPDEAARQFWEAVARTMPECAKGQP
jgi:hypothetical protein